MGLLSQDWLSRALLRSLSPSLFTRLILFDLIIHSLNPSLTTQLIALLVLPRIGARMPLPQGCSTSGQGGSLSRSLSGSLSQDWLSRALLRSLSPSLFTRLILLLLAKNLRSISHTAIGALIASRCL